MVFHTLRTHSLCHWTFTHRTLGRDRSLLPTMNIPWPPAEDGKRAHLCLCLAVLTAAASIALADAAESDRVAALAAGGAFLLAVGSCLRLLRLDPLSPTMVYLYVFGVFHLGLVVPWAVGLHSEHLPDWMIEHRLAPALTLVAIAVMAYQAGASVAMWKWPNPRQLRKPVRYHNLILYDCGLVILLAGCLMFVWGVRSLGFTRLLEATYFETYRLTNWYDPRFFVTSLYVVPIGLYLVAAAAPQRCVRWVLCLLTAWSGVIFFLGFRGFALIPALTVLVVLNKRDFRLSNRVYVLALFAVLVAIPAVTVMRASPVSERSISEVFRSARPLAALKEMGASLRPLVHTLHYMETESHRWGKTYWRGLISVLPNLSSEWEGRSYEPLEELPPSHWVTKQASPWTYERYGGLGFSTVAEPYMNFGTPGVVIYFLLLPVFLIWADRFDAARPTRLAMWAVLFGPLLWTTRNSFDNFFRPAIIGLGCVLAARLAVNSLTAIGRFPTAPTHVEGQR